MTRSYTLRCKRGSGRHWHKKSETCKEPCKSIGPGLRRSPKSPYSCIQTKARGGKKTASISPRLRKMYSAGKIVAAMRKLSDARKRRSKSASSSSSSSLLQFDSAVAGGKSKKVAVNQLYMANGKVYVKKDSKKGKHALA